MKTMTFKQFKDALTSVPSKSVSFRDMGGNRVEMLSIVRGSVTRLGVIQLPTTTTDRGNDI